MTPVVTTTFRLLSCNRSNGYETMLRSCYGTAVSLDKCRFQPVAKRYGRGALPLPYVALRSRSISRGRNCYGQQQRAALNQGHPGPPVRPPTGQTRHR
jgi:hypothetical protein